jgi:hypothetical protein
MGEIKNTAMASFYAEGVKDEQLRILAICKEVACSNEIGEFVYLSDLEAYLEDVDAPYPKSLILALLSAELKRIKALPMSSNSPAEIIRSMAAVESAINSVYDAKLMVN